MITIGVILIIVAFFLLSGLVSVSNQLTVIAKNQIEIISTLKNK